MIRDAEEMRDELRFLIEEILDECPKFVCNNCNENELIPNDCILFNTSGDFVCPNCGSTDVEICNLALEQEELYENQ